MADSLPSLPNVPNSSPNEEVFEISWKFVNSSKQSLRGEKKFIFEKLWVFNIDKPEDEIELFILNRWQKLINEKHEREELIRSLNDLKRNHVTEANRRCENLLRRSMDLRSINPIKLLTLSLLSKSNYLLDNFDEALKNQQELLRCVEEFNEYQELVRVESLEEIGKILVKLGRLGEAVSILEYRLSLTPPPSLKRSVWLRNLLSMSFFNVDNDKCKNYAEESLKDSEKLGGLWIGICSAISGFAEINCNNLKIGLELMNRALDLCQIDGNMKRIKEIKQEIFRVNDLMAKELKSTEIS